MKTEEAEDMTHGAATNWQMVQVEDVHSLISVKTPPCYYRQTHIGKTRFRADSNTVPSPSRRLRLGIGTHDERPVGGGICQTEVFSVVERHVAGVSGVASVVATLQPVLRCECSRPRRRLGLSEVLPSFLSPPRKGARQAQEKLEKATHPS